MTSARYHLNETWRRTANLRYKAHSAFTISNMTIKHCSSFLTYMLNGQAMPVNFPASKWAGKECFSTDAEEQSG